MPETTVVTTIVQLGAFGVLAYLVIRWQREDLAKGRDEIMALAKRAIDVQEQLDENLMRIATVLGNLCAKFNVPTDPLISKKE